MTCSRCRSTDVVPVVSGFPADEESIRVLEDAIARGEVVYTGCEPAGPLRCQACGEDLPYAGSEPAAEEGQKIDGSTHQREGLRIAGTPANRPDSGS